MIMPLIDPHAERRGRIYSYYCCQLHPIFIPSTQLDCNVVLYVLIRLLMMYISARAFSTSSNSNGPFKGESGINCSSGGTLEQLFHTRTTSSLRPTPTASTSSLPQLPPLSSSAFLISSVAPAPENARTPLPISSISASSATTANQTILAPTNGLVPLADGSGLNSAAIIGATLGSLLGFVLLIGLLDVLLLSRRIQRIIKRSPLSRYDTRPPIAPRKANTIKRKPLPPPSVPFYDKEIKHSRSLSLDSGYSMSRYSRSTWGWSGGVGGTDRDSREWLRRSMEEQNELNRYSVFETDDSEDERWVEMERRYSGKIRPGMGVQKRYTGMSFFEGDIREAQEDLEPGYRKRDGVGTWGVHDPLERWKKGLHPLTGRRGEGMVSIGYY